MLYLAYGSNMARARIEARLGPCRWVAVGRLDRHALRFHKRGRDGSGKCDAFHTGRSEDRLFGVVFDLSAEQSKRLDEFEGPGYVRRTVPVAAAPGELEAYTYVARPEAIDETLAPYGWYHAFVVHGAAVSGLPAPYVAVLRAVPTVPDPDPARHRCNARVLDQ